MGTAGREAPSGRRRRRARRLGVLGVGIVALVLAASGVVSGVRAARLLEAGRASLTRGASLLGAGDVEAAARSFDRAARLAERAHDLANGPILDAAALLPLAGRTPDALRHLTSAARSAALAGSIASNEIAALPDGLATLGLTGGRIPLGTLASVAPTIGRARALLEGAARETQLAATTFVPEVVADAVDEARYEVGRAAATVRGVDELLSVLPKLAGADGRRRYFLAAQTPAELRGTGGFIGSYAILTLDRGAIRLGPFRSIHRLPDLPRDRAVWPSSEAERALSGFDSASVWRMANVTPDVPTAAALIEGLWERTGHRPLDGTVFVDVQALESLLRPLGPVEVPGVPAALTADTVTGFVTSDVYALHPEGEERKDFLGAVGQAVFGRFLASADGAAMLRALMEAVGRGHIRMSAADPDVQSALEAVGVAGSLRASDGLTLATALNNIGGNKLDVYLQQDVAYEVELLAAGRARVRIRLTLRNGAPPHAEPGTVFGPYREPRLAPYRLVSGEMYLQAFVFCGAGCRVVGGSSGGEPVPLQSYPWRGLTMASTSLRIDPGRDRTLWIEFAVRDAWGGDASAGEHLLEVAGQSLLDAPRATISLAAPEGTSVAWASDGVTVRGSRAFWSGELGARRSVEIRFEPGVLERLWSALTA